MTKFIVFGKGDDYGACRTELVETTLHNAKEYYSYITVDDADAVVLEKYFDLLSFDEEKERSSDERYYGSN